MSSLKPSGLKAPSKISKPGTVAAKSSAVTAAPVKAVEKPTPPVPVPAPAPAPVETTEGFVDDFRVGEHVWVNGNKPGFIQFLGETQFAPGQWAGIVLDESIGKNDGAVAGVRYFQCEALRGIFTRPSKLSRKPLEEDSNGTQTASRATSPTSALTSASIVSSSVTAAQTPLKSLTTAAKDFSTPAPSSNLTRTGSESISNLSETGSVKKGERELKLGDRVLVSGSKAGVIRFLGETDFAKGEWCGVELDEPLGKNDGAVAGTRYFQCQAKYGLFAPVHKVTRIGFPSTTPAKAKTTVRKVLATPSTPASLKRSPSASSISSMSSISSSVSNKPSRTGLLTETSSRYARKISGTTALQEALKEKQQHIEQLMAERDMERAEVAKATSHVGEVEQELNVIRDGHEQYVMEMEAKLDQLHSMVEAADREKVELANLLEEEKRRVEDLQFRVEEESITKGDLEVATVSEKSRIMELEKDLGLKAKEVTNLRQRLVECSKQSGDVDTSLSLLQEVNSLQENIAKMTKEHEQELSSLKEKLECVEHNHEKDVGTIKASMEKISKENETLKVKLNHADKENADVTEMWQSKLVSAVSSHQKSMEELTLSVSKGPSTDASALIELKARLENLKLEHQKETEQLKSKRDTVQTEHLKQIDLLKSRLQELNEGKESELEALKSKLEAAEEQHLIEMEDALNKLHDNEVKKKHIGSSNEEASGLKTNVQALEKRLRDSDDKVQQLLSAKTKLENQISEMIQSSGDSSIQLTKINEQLQSREKNLEDLQAQLSQAKETVSQLNETINALKSEAKRYSEEAQEGHKAEIKKSVTQIEELKLLVEKSQKENKELLKVYEKSIADLSSQHQTAVTALKEDLQAKEELLESSQRNYAEELKQQTEQAKVSQVAEESLRVVEQVTAEKNNLLKEKVEAASALDELKKLHSKVQKELDDLKGQHKSAGEQISKTNEHLKGEILITESLKKELEEAKLAAEHKSRQLAALQEENLKLAEELGRSKEEVTTHQKLEEERSVLNNQLLEMKKRESLKQKAFDDEKVTLQKSLSATNALINEKDKELERLRNEVIELQGENESARNLQLTVRSLESEKMTLEKKVQNLQTELSDNKKPLSNASDSSGDGSFSSQFLEEKASMQGQIDFLNSVIIDLQRKNDDLKLKLEKMIEASLNGNTVEEMDNHDSLNGTQAKKKVPPRLFCDICDCFDLHDTEDCPTQTQLPDSPPHSNFHGNRKEERPYCDICEVFGHWTNGCNDDETF